ncbi:MAG TPA: histidinol dehydrogenase [Candidatus Sumerlaeota bacterium]|nr:histidinol dehydrogenase [Candidatus Sumerlaeota bacterium]
MMRFLQHPKDNIELARYVFNVDRDDPKVEASVKKIIRDVRVGGDEAVLEYTKRFDGVRMTPAQMAVPVPELRKAWEGLEPGIRAAIEIAADRIRRFHEFQKPAGYVLKDRIGMRMEYRIAPLRCVGLYVPGGTAAYPSSVLMNAIPAQIAGVDEIIMCTPPGKDGIINPAILGAAWFLGLKKVFRVGGAQAVAAMAWGTETIPRVDKVVGPGNAFVAAAKKLLYGRIDIDMIAGPSEILIIADKSSPMPYVVADLLSQAEHDTKAVVTLVHVGPMNKKAFLAELERQVEASPRRDFIREALKNQGTVILADSVESAILLANERAPEHLEVMIPNAARIAKLLRNAGAIFIGPYTPEPIGDYVAGPNHVLPTVGTARFFSPLSVTDFTKATSVLELSRPGFEKLAGPAITLAEKEGLHAHAESVRIRLAKPHGEKSGGRKSETRKKSPGKEL